MRPALAELRQLGRLPSATRLAALGKLTKEELTDARGRIAAIQREAAALARIEAHLTVASRIRLYARVAAWHAEHPHERELDSSCIVCGSDLEGVLDPSTGLAVAHHMLRAAGDDAALLSQTIGQWSETTRGALARDLPGPLRMSLTEPLPDHPGDLVRDSLCTELFQTAPVGGVLGSLKQATAAACDAELVLWPPLAGGGLPPLEGASRTTEPLQTDLRNLDLALRFAEHDPGKALPCRQNDASFSRHGCLAARDKVRRVVVLRAPVDRRVAPDVCTSSRRGQIRTSIWSRVPPRS